MRLSIGLDFDNTLITYDTLMHRVAHDRGLIGPDTPKSKNSVRNSIRATDQGEIRWQEVQADVYGLRIIEAPMADGARAFIENARNAGATLYIISHKTEYAAQDTARVNLREAALGWMRKEGFFGALGFKAADVFFTSTRQDKCERLASLGCTHFVDDLIEVLTDGAFPADCEKILFDPHGMHRDENHEILRFGSWHEIGAHILAR